MRSMDAIVKKVILYWGVHNLPPFGRATNRICQGLNARLRMPQGGPQPLKPAQSCVSTVRAAKYGLDGIVDIVNEARLRAGEGLPNIDPIAPKAAFRSRNAARACAHTVGAPLRRF